MSSATVQIGVLRLPPDLARWADFVTAASQHHGVPESLLFAVMARESGGRNVNGDAGHGRGLMQVDDRSHGEWLKRNNGGADPESNIDQGAEILRDAIDFFDRHQALVPALSDTGFRLRCGIAAYNCGCGLVLRAVHGGLDPDHYTTGGDYSADVQRRRAEFLATPQEQP